jgi:hypothetical protein
MRKISLKYRFTALLMSVLMLVSSSGVAMDMHYCQDELKSVRLIVDAPTCHDQAAKAEKPACHKKAKEGTEKKCHKAVSDPQDETCENDCCSHEVIHAQLDADLLKSEWNQLENFSQITQLFLSTFILTYNSNYDTGIVQYRHYKPPLPDKDIPVLIQSFLI